MRRDLYRSEAVANLQCHCSQSFPLPELRLSSLVFFALAVAVGMPALLWQLRLTQVVDVQLLACRPDPVSGWEQLEFRQIARSGAVQESIPLTLEWKANGQVQQALGTALSGHRLPPGPDLLVARFETPAMAAPTKTLCARAQAKQLVNPVLSTRRRILELLIEAMMRSHAGRSNA